MLEDFNFNPAQMISDLNKIHPFGMDVFKKNLGVLDIKPSKIIITGKHRFSLKQR